MIANRIAYQHNSTCSISMKLAVVAIYVAVYRL
jgi:hypothetical protein